MRERELWGQVVVVVVVGWAKSTVSTRGKPLPYREWLPEDLGRKVCRLPAEKRRYLACPKRILQLEEHLCRMAVSGRSRWGATCLRLAVIEKLLRLFSLGNSELTD